MNVADMPKRMSLDDFVRNHHWENMTDSQLGFFHRALHTAIFRHQNQKRDDGGEYYEHVLVVANAIRHLGFDIYTQSVCLLHDVAEDSDITSEELRKYFGVKVADMVQFLSKKEDNKSIYWDQLYCGTELHFELIFVKMVDRWHNLVTVYGFRDLERRIRYLEETLGPFNSLLERCRPLIPKSHLADYDELWTVIHFLAQKRLQRTKRKLSNRSNK